MQPTWPQGEELQSSPSSSKYKGANLDQSALKNACQRSGKYSRTAKADRVRYAARRIAAANV
jgi:hypothetical protein